MKSIFLFFFAILSGSSFSQTEKVLEIGKTPFSYYNYDFSNYIINDNKLFTIEKRLTYQYYRIIDLNQKNQIAYNQFDSDAKYLLNDIGLFYIKNTTYSNYEYTFIDLNGNENTSSTIINYTLNPSKIYLTNTANYFYYFTIENNKNCIYETAGSLNTELKIFETFDDIVYLDNLNENVIFITFNGSNYEFYKYNKTSGNTLLFHSFSSVELFNVYKSGTKGNDIYINFVNNQNQFIYKTDLTNSNSQLFLNSKIGKISFINNGRFVLRKDSSLTINPYLIASINSPNVSKLLTIKSTDSLSGTIMPQGLGSNHFILGILEKGFEMAYINNQDSIEYVSDLVEGYGTSFCLRNYATSTYLYYHLKLPYIELNDTTLLTIQTNGNDNFYYVYKTTNNQQISLFKIDNPLNVKKFFIDKVTNTLYWLEYQGGEDKSSLLFKRNLDDIDPQQPTINTEKETWFKQIATTKNNDFFEFGGNLKTKPKDLKIDTSGNIYTYFTYYYSYLWDEIRSGSVFSTDTNSLIDLKSRHIFSKFDKYGKFQWTTSIGEPFNSAWFDYEFEIDSDNNVIILGYYFETGYFDDDSLTSPRACYFITKLNGETGKVIWKNKIAETYYTDDIYIDAMTLDENDNIYLAFMYTYFDVQIQDQSLSTDLSRVNALAKFNAEGDVVWLKNILTPWTDYYGKTTILNVNPNQTMTVCQTKVTGKEQFNQVIDFSGNIIDTSLILSPNYVRLLVGINNSNNQFFGFGYFNEELEFDKFKITSSVSKNFSFVYDNKLLRPINMYQGLSILFYAVDILFYNSEFYVYGAIKVGYSKYELVLLKFDSEGTFLAHKRMNQFVTNGDERDFNSFEIKDDFIILLGHDFNLDSENGVVPLITSNRSISILKIKNEGWIEDEDWFEQINTYLKPEENDVLIYPNPFMNEFEIIFSSFNVEYQSYKIYNSNGTIVLEGNLNDIQFQKVIFENFSAGTYILQLIGYESTITKKIVKIK